MRAAILRDNSGQLVIEDVNIDDPSSSEVLIKVVASGLCHSDLNWIEGDPRVTYPMILGHEAAGIVQACGKDVLGFEPGDHVVTCGTMFCGHCNTCLSGSSYMCENQQTIANRSDDAEPRLTDQNGTAIRPLAGMGAFAEQMLVHQHGVQKISKDMPLDSAALLGCAVTTGVGAVANSADIELGSSVAVIGCGGVGISVIQGARLSGARQIIAIDLAPKKLELAKQFGATHTVNPADDDPIDQVRKLSNGGVDYSFECIGSKSTAEQAFAMAGRRGLATVVGFMKEGVDISISGADLFRSAKRLQGSIIGSSNFRVDIPHYCDLFMCGHLKLEEMISQRIKLEQINEGFAAMRSGEVIRSVIEFS